MIRSLIAILMLLAFAVVLPSAAHAAKKKAVVAKPKANDSISGSTSSVSNPSASSVLEIPMKRPSWRDRISAGFYNSTTTRLQAGNEAAVVAYNYGLVDYSFQDARFVSVRPAFAFASSQSKPAVRRGEKPKETGTQMRLEDLILAVGDLELQKGGLVDFAGEIRLYAPTSELSQEQGLITRIAPKLVGTARLPRGFEVAGILEPEYNFQSQTGYVATDGRSVRGNREFGYWNQLELRYRINRLFGTALALGHEQYWHHAVSLYRVPRTRTENATLEAGGTLNYGPVFAVAGLSQRHDTARPVRGLSLFAAEETEVFLRSLWRF